MWQWTLAEWTLAEFWAGVLGLALLLYVLLDGFDLGIGILFPLAPDEAARRDMLASISPVWDGNETWLVVAGATLFGAFPLAYSILIPAFYLPVLVMLGALILRGVAFEFRHRSRRLRRLWDAGFVGGSYAATFAQGAAELPVTGHLYSGGNWGWFSPFAVLCGVGLCLGYAMLGAGWLTSKTERDARDLGYRVLPFAFGGVLLFLGAAFAWCLLADLRVLHRWIERPYLIVFPIVGLIACAAMVRAILARRDAIPFLAGAAIFAAAFGTLAASFLPYMVPFSLTIAQAAAPESSLRFLFWGAGIIVLPMTLIYTCVVYFVFKGKTIAADYH